MTKIVCKDTNCQHNCCSQCLKESIKVSKRAFCHSFDGKNDNLPNKFKEELAEEMLTEKVDSHYIYCEAKNCASNENGYCIKNSIEVRNKDFGAKCISFHER